ncbi:hypothetical protein ACFVAJ_17110 [Agromyces sp. NPDC057679]|uniref:hypothetical protein n=1 Tax=Agromyces sp. NPDC057679 TaxID=3346207 RepID=UPI00366DB301
MAQLKQTPPRDRLTNAIASIERVIEAEVPEDVDQALLSWSSQSSADAFAASMFIRLTDATVLRALLTVLRSAVEDFDAAVEMVEQQIAGSGNTDAGDVERLTAWHVRHELRLADAISGELPTLVVKRESGPSPYERIFELEQDVASYDLTITAQGKLLTGVVNAVRGEPGPLRSHSHHDAVELVTAVVEERDRLAAERTTIT